MAWHDKSFNASGDIDGDPALVIAPSAARGTTGTGSAVEVGDYHTLRLALAVTAHAGTTPTLDVALQTAPDPSGTWVAVASFAQVTTTDGTQRKAFAGLDRFVRASWTIGGTGGPSYTFSLTGEGVMS